MKKFKLPTTLAPNKETDANKCEWRGNTCFFCDMQTEA